MTIKEAKATQRTASKEDKINAIIRLKQSTVARQARVQESISAGSKIKLPQISVTTYNKPDLKKLSSSQLSQILKDEQFNNAKASRYNSRFIKKFDTAYNKFAEKYKARYGKEPTEDDFWFFVHDRSSLNTGKASKDFYLDEMDDYFNEGIR